MVKLAITDYIHIYISSFHLQATNNFYRYPPIRFPKLCLV